MKNAPALLLLIAFFSYSCFAQAGNDKTVIHMEHQLEHVGTVNFHPNLLPIILRNSDFMGLNPQQVNAFKSWGKTNFKPMVTTMNEIIHKRIEFQEATLSPSISADILRQRQEEIFQLHRKLLEFKLSCRENIVQTFNQENWDGFMMVLGEEGFPIPSQAATAELATITSKPDILD